MKRLSKGRMQMKRKRKMKRERARKRTSPWESKTKKRRT